MAHKHCFDPIPAAVILCLANEIFGSDCLERLRCSLDPIADQFQPLSGPGPRRLKRDCTIDAKASWGWIGGARISGDEDERFRTSIGHTNSKAWNDRIPNDPPLARGWWAKASDCTIGQRFFRLHCGPPTPMGTSNTF